jgi:hypothetical protein
MKCGILIIGSLLWDEDTAGRPEWRTARLNVANRLTACAPFYYGRRSTSRANTFTMAFGDDVPFAQGALVPCINDFQSPADLIIEASHLWKAEAPGAAWGTLSANWGAVGAIFRPGLDNIDIKREWALHLTKGKVQCPPIIDANGLSHIPWPKMSSGDLVDFDVILLTATKADTKRPTPQDIADAWLAQDEGHEKYFFLNVQHDIRTPDDLEIWAAIKHGAPSWLRSKLYTPAINILEADLFSRK